MFQAPSLPETWAHFATWRELPLALLAILLISLQIIWWRQQTRYWFRIATATLLAAILLNIGSIYLFVVPPHGVGCQGICAGRAGYPLSVALLPPGGGEWIAPVDFVLNLLLLWLVAITALLAWVLLGTAFQWWRRSWRARVPFVLLVFVLPWALMPRILNPPEPRPVGEELRLTTNARRAAEFTYRISGIWVHRLALEDIREVAPDTVTDVPASLEQQGVTQVCLRSYTYFYVPWRRYRITLDASGTTPLNLVQMSLDEPCWELLPGGAMP
jgi:hypothetical protein